ncbi:hypothetical protein [Actinomadura parmotrematis]|uniref:Uncharacterized protein n=1 Tax=Actinomadura parmotrematis TaxID=2864039 RepID=A0ABS7G612_9ACTN|nr:hypothetical protein [Actinomadura parmotrematis]MBW8487314.1 hypothetical protein [Actinomadura parmotrematis]
MSIDLDAATDFMATHARLLDRRRFAVLLGDGEPAALLAAVNAYRNPDGGYGNGLEPDLRSPESQTGSALHAFEVFADLPPADEAVALCDWLATVSRPDGGVPFALPVIRPAGCAPFWTSASPASSLQITAAVAAQAHRVQDPRVAAHPWLEGATAFCLDAMERLEEAPNAIELMFSLHLLDALGDGTAKLAERLGHFIPDDGWLRVAGGQEDEKLGPLDFAPSPDGHVRALFSAATVAEELDALAGEQLDDGGWTVDFANYSPAATLEWRGYATVQAVAVLRRNGRA